ncbi:MAG TPA: type II toxin-antitoxin system ParD family antitoxin [Alphaproteobacteria bacterium]|nr:type II toxin-antitoxin system ParD family antitoxin [Alphaproteobacteria bacterium]
MHINLSPEMEKYLESKVAEGFYGNASEVVRDALRRLREDDRKIAALRAAVKVGEEQIARGESQPLTPELIEEITQQAIANAKAGKKINPDVLP